jgi:hypothetical protein
MKLPEPQTIAGPGLSCHHHLHGHGIPVIQFVAFILLSQALFFVVVCMFVIFVSETGSVVLLRLVSNSWTVAILVPQSPELQTTVTTIIPGFFLGLILCLVGLLLPGSSDPPGGLE